MLQLYYWPMACSLASRIALMEAGIEARYRLVHLWNKKVIDDDSDFCAVSPKGAVPVLILENGERLTENAAVRNISPTSNRSSAWRRRPTRPTAIGCRSGSPSSVPRSTRRFCFRPSGTRTMRRKQLHGNGSARTCRSRPAILPTGPISSATASRWPTPTSPGGNRGGVDVAQWPALVGYLERMRQRPQVSAAIEQEMQLRKTVTV